MTTDIYKIRNITNLHAGSGDANYGIVDKLVQRDPITEYPVIHSSSLKGSLREFVGEAHPDVVEIFGNDPKNNKPKSIPGTYFFFEARLLSIPIRSNAKPFFRATTLSLIDAFVAQLEDLGLSDLADKYAINDVITVADGTPKIAKLEGIPSVILEDWTAEQDLSNSIAIKISALIGENIALLSEKDFKTLAENLPVIARNYLENGISQNLWYEEIVPRESVFFTAVRRPDKSDKLALDGQLVQIGGNATVGYGFCKFSKLI